MSKHQDFPVRRALISVSDKTNLAAFAKKLELLGIEIVSTGGTATYLRDSGIPVTPVSQVTNFPEILEGRVKTLHPAIHGGILANIAQSSAVDALAAHNIAPIGLVVINLYPFEETVKKSAHDIVTMIETIDVGGPAMLRAAAKNHSIVTVVCDPADYDAVAEELSGQSRTTKLATRRRLAAKTFARTAAYDFAIAAWFASIDAKDSSPAFSITGNLKQTLRYGENPHQQAALYQFGDHAGAGIVGARQVQGKEQLQQSDRRRRRFRADFRVCGRGGRGRHHQARQSLRRCGRRLPGGGLQKGVRLRPRQRIRRHCRLERRARRGGGA